MTSKANQQAHITQRQPVLIIVNGLPSTGKTTLARRLAADIHLPVFSRDGIYETLYDALECQSHGSPPLLGTASFTFLYSIASTILAAGQSLLVEGFFGRPELRTAEFLDLQHTHDFEPLQILCHADGELLLQRFLARMASPKRHAGHSDSDQEWLSQNKQRLLQGHLTPLALPGPLIDIDTTPHSFDYADVLQRVRAVLANMRTS